jgi:hypothetical protein
MFVIMWSLLDLIYMTFVVAFIAVAVFGHIPLAARAIYKPLRDDRAAGRSSIPETAPTGLVFAVGHDGCH